MDCHSHGVEIDSGLVPLSLGSPSSWVLTWFWKGMEKVIPQPVCSSKGDQNLVAGVEDPDQVQGQGDLRVEEGSAEGCGAREAIPCTPCNVCLSQQAGVHIPGPCGTGESGETKSPGELNLNQRLLSWTQCSFCYHPDPPELARETEPTESPSQPNPGTLEPKEEPAAEAQPDFQASSLPPPGDPIRLMEWLLHRLEMALPQPVLHRKAAEQVSGQSGRRDPGWVVVRKGSWKLRKGSDGWPRSLGMGTQQEGSHQRRLSLDASLCAHICSVSILPEEHVEHDLILEEVDPCWEDIHQEDSASQKEGSACQQEDSASQQKGSACQQDSACQQEDSASQQEDSASQQEDSASQQEDSASQQEDSASQQEDSASQQETEAAPAYEEESEAMVERPRELPQIQEEREEEEEEEEEDGEEEEPIVLLDSCLAVQADVDECQLGRTQPQITSLQVESPRPREPGAVNDGVCW
ncbi:Cyclic nucleotide-gated cation channel beta-1 [Lemmus lemmus]